MARARAGAEALAVAALLLILVGLPAAVVVYQFVVRPAVADVRVIDITARVPEAGGFSPETIRIAAGEAVRLRFSVPDVTHGIAIGPGLGIDLGHVDPGQVREVRVTFDRPGRYTLYCNAWCSPSHWRMRGTILVYDPAHPDGAIPTEAPDPVIESLVARRVDIDAPHDAPATPGAPFRITRGAQVVERLGTTLPRELAERDWRRRHSPAEAWARLVDGGLAADAAWDAVASLWVGSLDRARLETAATLFAKNCAACHGESGDGRGPGAAALAAQGIGQHDDSKKAARPADFTRARSMLGGTSERYYAKLRRGGMGTGMPSWGPILTPDETWMLVDYLWTFVFGRDGLARTDSTRSRTLAVAPGTASLEARSDESHMVTASYCSRRSDHGVHAGAGELTEIADLHPIVSNERAKHIAVLGQVVLCEGCHHTAGIEERDIDPCPITKPELMTDPAVLDEPGPLGSDDDVHAEPARLEATLGPNLVQPRECGRRHDREWKYIEERTDGDRRLHSERGEKRRSELLRDNRVPVAPGVCALDVRMVLVDGEVIGGNPRQPDIAPKVG